MKLTQNFPFKLTQIINAYNLSPKELSAILNLDDPSLILKWENNIEVPSSDIISELIYLFGVSPSWIYGTSEQIYNDTDLTKVENDLLDTNYNMNNVDIYLLKKLPWIPTEYKDEMLRKKYYSLEVRGNLIFLLNMFLTKQIKSLDRYQLSQNKPAISKLLILQNKFKHIFNRSEIEFELSKSNEYIINLRKLLNEKNEGVVIYNINNGD